jgi:hypothetical protein
MTASELLYSVDGKVRLDVKLGVSTLTIKSIVGGTSIVDTIFRFYGLDNEILNAPARIKEPLGGFTVVLVDMEDAKKMKDRKK